MPAKNIGGERMEFDERIDSDAGLPEQRLNHGQTVTFKFRYPGYIKARANNTIFGGPSIRTGVDPANVTRARKRVRDIRTKLTDGPATGGVKDH